MNSKLGTKNSELGTLYLLPTNTCFGIACEISDIKSYNKIYNIKKRSLDKPLAIMVEDFSWLEKNTDLTDEQIDFLKNYEKPFTVLADCPHLKLWLNYHDEQTGEEFLNRDIYEQFAFRVAHTKAQKKLIHDVGPIFLTSANYSNEPEIYSYDELEITFGNLLENSKKMKFIGDTSNLKNTKPSEIFSFDGESIEQVFIRK